MLKLRRRLQRGAVLGVAFGALLVPATGEAATSTTTSTNWAGYAVTGKTYRRVSGSWVQPAVDCSASGTTTSYSATWVGLGGYSTTSTALEQIGTEADCSRGTAAYSSWYELVPEAAKDLTLKVHAGDKLSASVTVTGSTVRMRLANLTTGKSVVKVRTTSNLDLTSAEWIQETPSTCNASGTSCQVLPLADFGAVTFSNASATTKSGYRGSITDAVWTTTAINLIESSTTPGGRFPGGSGRTSVSASTGATTGATTAAGTSFTVTYADDLTVSATTRRAAVTLAAARAGSTTAGDRRSVAAPAA